MKQDDRNDREQKTVTFSTHTTHVTIESSHVKLSEYDSNRTKRDRIISSLWYRQYALQTHLNSCREHYNRHICLLG